MSRVLPEVDPRCEWVLAGEGRATRKFDGTCVMLDSAGAWWARREVKAGKLPPENFYAVGLDEATGKQVGWEPIEQSPFAKFHAEAVRGSREAWLASRDLSPHPGTYELCGPKINKNPEGHDEHVLVRHIDADEVALVPGMLTFEGLRDLLTGPSFRFEGIVWHHPDGRMAKLKRRDFRS